MRSKSSRSSSGTATRRERFRHYKISRIDELLCQWQPKTAHTPSYVTNLPTGCYDGGRDVTIGGQDQLVAECPGLADEVGVGVLGALLLPGLDPLFDGFVPPGDHQADQTGKFTRGRGDGNGRVRSSAAGSVPGSDEGLASPGAHGHAQRLPDRIDRLGLLA